MKQRQRGLEHVAGRAVPRETLDKLDAYQRLLVEEAGRQNLIAASTLEDLWNRHVLDSAQLVRFEPWSGASWADVGSGAGLPGIVVACLVEGPVTLIEPRRLRADFLHRMVEALSLNAMVVGVKVERASGSFDVITARAVASLAKLLSLSSHLSTRKTRFVFPKGRSGPNELAEAQQTWQGSFHVEPSLTDQDSVIILGSGVGARKR